MARIGIYLTRRQVLYLQRLLIVTPPKETPEMANLVYEVNKTVEFVRKSTEQNWDSYEWDESEERRAEHTNGTS